MPQPYPSLDYTTTTTNMDIMPLDVDDSIVLSDLLRTGEASRLRRRGAMRIDHSSPHHTISGGHEFSRPPRLSPPNVVLVERSNSDSDSDLESPSFTSYNMVPSDRATRRHSHSSRRFGPYPNSGVGSSSQRVKEEYVYTLVCGSEVADCDSDDVEPFTPSILPLYPPPASPSPSKRQKPVKKSTGCGTVVHSHAAPKSRFRRWTAGTAASETVIPLEGCYFDETESSYFTKSLCGCQTEGVGCAVCGNPLGTRYTPCKSALEGGFCPHILDKHLPASSQDWSSPKSLHSKPNRYVFTFFSDAVTPTPSFSFPPTPVRPARSGSIESHPVSPPNPSPPFVPPERYMYSPYDDEESDNENYLSHSWDWQSSISSPSSNVATVLPNQSVSFPPRPASPYRPVSGMMFDRFIDVPPSPIHDQPTSQQQPWGMDPPSPTHPLRTRTGREGRWSSIGRSFPSLSSGLGGTGMHDDLPISPLSFYDRQLMVASERESRNGDGDITIIDAVNDVRPTISTQTSSTTLNLDGEAFTQPRNEICIRSGR